MTQAGAAMRTMFSWRGSAPGGGTVCVARTIADLDGSAGVRRIHIAEALAYRRVVPGRARAAA